MNLYVEMKNILIYFSSSDFHIGDIKLTRTDKFQKCIEFTFFILFKYHTLNLTFPSFPNTFWQTINWTKPYLLTNLDTVSLKLVSAIFHIFTKDSP